MNKFLFALIYALTFFLATNPLKAQYPSDSAQVYLLTASPGEETYAAFGHSAIRVADHTRGMDIVFNYGTFDFSTPNFYWKFSTGRLMYSLSIQDYRRFLHAYNSWGQAIYEQHILLTNKEKWQLINNLEINNLPENKYYRYDFFKDNCATRIRDIVTKSVDGSVLFDSAYVTQPQSFRQMIAKYLNRQPWTFFGINLLLGKGTDSIATLSDYMFLPADLRDIFARSTIVGDSSRLLTGKPVELFPTTLEFTKPSPLTSPVTALWILGLIVVSLSYLEYRSKVTLRWFDFFMFLVTGLLGALILFLMTASLHKVLAHNYNIVWANPVNLIIAAGLFLKTRPAWYRYITLCYGILVALFIPFSFLIYQDIPDAAYPLMVILLSGVYRIFKK